MIIRTPWPSCAVSIESAASASPCSAASLPEPTVPVACSTALSSTRRSPASEASRSVMRHLALAIIWAAWLAAPSLPAARAQESTLHIGLREDPDLLDPILGSSYVGRIVFAGICDKLFDITPDLKIVPQLASGYEYKDPTHLVIRLRPNVQFQDGEPVDAEAVKFTLLRALTVKGSMRRGEINSITSIEVIDPLTVELALKAPDAPLLSQLTDRSGMVLPPKVVEQEGDKFGLHPVCSGPFSFVERVPQDRIVLQRFPGYWNAGAI